MLENGRKRLLTATCFIRAVTTVINIITDIVLWNAISIAALKFIFCTRFRGWFSTCNLRTSLSQTLFFCETWLLPPAAETITVPQVNAHFPTFPSVPCREVGTMWLILPNRLRVGRDTGHLQAEAIKKPTCVLCVSSAAAATLRPGMSGDKATDGGAAQPALALLEWERRLCYVAPLRLWDLWDAAGSINYSE